MRKKNGFISTSFLVLAVSLVLAGSSWAAVQYLGDGAIQNNHGGWDMPLQGSCPADPAQLTRPDCLGLRLNIVQASCVAPNYSWTTSGVCNDQINNTQALCQARPDRMWNNSTGVCAIVMRGDDRNNVVCALHGGAWVTAGTCTGAWVMPARDNAAYGSSGLLTGSGPGDQCLRCHNSHTQYNGPRVRDVEEMILTGHKNMARKVVPGMAWGGPPFHCTVGSSSNEEACEADGGEWVPVASYPSDDAGNIINWTTGKINVGGAARDLKWIYGDWLAPLPRAIYINDRPGTCSNPAYTVESICTANGGIWTASGAGISYSCGRCHTTGWTSDGSINTAKEPEKSFPGISWDPVAHAGYVNLKGNVTGDSNNFSSWDVWGVSCTRCHSSAVDNTTGVPPYSSAAGMSSHHSDVTGPNVSTSGDKGYCTDSRFTAQTQCSAAGAAWLTQCSKAGVCSNPIYTDSGSCVLNLATWTMYNDSTTCSANGGTWGVTPVCSVAGSCNKGTCSNAAFTNYQECVANSGTWTGYSDQAACTTASGQWAAATDIVRCIDAGGRWTGNKSNRGQIITALCMNCHRQETGGLPFDGGVDPAGKVTVAQYHETVTFPSHPHGNQFLNSPHGKFTGTSAQIATAKYGSGYSSHFQFDGEAAGTGNGCTGCHDPHQSVIPETGTKAVYEECTECHAKNLNKMLARHPGGVGTPLEHMSSDPSEACVSCHMPEGVHLFRINPDTSYSTFPSGVFGSYADSASCLAAGGKSFISNVCYFDANTTPDDTYTKAAWVDVDLACGQCHGGGTATRKTKGSITAGSKVLTVLNATNIATGNRIRITGAGALGADFETYVSSVAGKNITLVGKASTTVNAKQVKQGPTKFGAGYMTKVQLAGFAAGMHNDAPVVSFYYQRDPANTLKVDVNATATTCNAVCNVYDWNWGDGSAHGNTVTSTHTYAAAGTYTITLTVTEYGVGTSSKSQNVNVYVPDMPPTIGGPCSFNPNTWVATINDSSTDDFGVFTVKVTWGDGSLTSNGPAGTTFNHTYVNAGSFTITRKVYDTIMQESTATCTAAPVYFTVSGLITKSNGITPVPSATLKLTGNGATKTLYSTVSGTYNFANLKPGTYTLTVTKTGYTFPAIAPIILGPSNVTNITAVTP